MNNGCNQMIMKEKVTKIEWKWLSAKEIKKTPKVLRRAQAKTIQEKRPPDFCRENLLESFQQIKIYL